ncbi:MAG: hypothetical protein ACR2FN_15045 [Chitinophagaceae bacterium]
MLYLTNYQKFFYETKLFHLLFSIVLVSGVSDKIKQSTINISDKSGAHMSSIKVGSSVYPPSTITLQAGSKDTITVYFTSNYAGGIEIEEEITGNTLKCSQVAVLVVLQGI